MKRRTLTLTLSILACIALIGVGFASWVMTFEDTEVVTGNIAVDTVDDKTHFITVSAGNKDLEVRFGAPATGSYESPWFTNTEMDQADMTASFTIEVTNYATAKVEAKDGKLTAKKGETPVDLASYSDYITYSIVVGDFTKVGDTTTGKATVTITFSWGTVAFNKKNPYDYYNSQTCTSELVTAAKTAMNKLAELNGCQFTVTLVASTKAA